MNHYMLAGFLACVTNMILAVLFLSKRFYSRTNRLFALLSVSVALYGIGFSLQAVASSVDAEMFAIRIILTGTVLIPVFYLYTAYGIVNREVPLITSILLGMVVVFFEWLNWGTELLAHSPIPRFGFRYLFQAGPVYPVLAIFFCSIIGLVMIQLIRWYRTETKGIRKNQLKYFFIGTVIMFTGGVPGFMLGYKTQWYPINPYGAYCVPFYCILIAYALSQYRLLGFRGLLKMLIAPLVAIGIIVGFLVIFQQHWIASQQRFFRVDEFIVFSILMIVVFACIYKITVLMLQRIMPQKDYRDLLYAGQRKLGECNTLEEIFTAVLDILQDRDGPRPSSAFILWKKGSNAPYQMQKWFGEVPHESISVFSNSSFIRLIHAHYIHNKKTDISPLLIRDALQKVYDEREAAELRAELERLHAQLCIPFIAQEKTGNRTLLGFLCVGSPTLSEVYDLEDYAFFQGMASHVTQALMTIEAREFFYQKMKERIEEKARKEQEEYQKQLLDASKRMILIRDLEQLASEIVAQLKQTIGIMYVGVYLYEPLQKAYVLRAYEGDPAQRGKGTYKYTRGLVALNKTDVGTQEEEVFSDETQEITVIDESHDFIRTIRESKEPALRGEHLIRWGDELHLRNIEETADKVKQLAACVILPLTLNKLLGFIVLGQKDSGQTYSDGDMKILGILANQAAMAIQNTYYSEEVIRDSMTKLYNHGYFQLKMREAVEMALRYNEWLSCLLIDIDHFKEYNDTHGHPAGDRILKEFATYLHRTSRSVDVACRYGGEEFGLIMPKTDLTAARIFAERLCVGMKTHPVLNSLTVSIGIGALYGRIVNMDSEIKEVEEIKRDLIVEADAQVYRAKAEGRNRVCWDQTLEELMHQGKETDASHKKQVLIVEDNLSGIRHIEYMLSRAGYEVTAAEGGGRGLEAFVAKRPDVVLLDLGLPDIDGEQILAKMQKLDATVPIGILSGYGERKEEVIRLGAKKFFLKPIFELDDIEEWVKKVTS